MKKFTMTKRSPLSAREKLRLVMLALLLLLACLAGVYFGVTYRD